MSDNLPTVQTSTLEIVEQSGIINLLKTIRPAWQSKRLIQRVLAILPHDPSSACQRILNAAIHDLREKIVIAGIDIAKECAATNKLPPIQKPDDIEHYSSNNTINLSYHMGLLSRPEWRKISRAYEIRRDLEHEDDQYEAGVEDCVYIFKSAIGCVLQKDPITLLKISDVKTIVERPNSVALESSLIDEYKYAPHTRQIEIYKFLISTALNTSNAEIVRQNCYAALKTLTALTKTSVILDVSRSFTEKLGSTPPTYDETLLAYAAGIMPYLKESHRKDIFTSIHNKLNACGHTFRSNTEHGDLLRSLIEIGGLSYCPKKIRRQIVNWLALCYIGEPGGYGAGTNRSVFYSNTGAPLSKKVLQAMPDDLKEYFANIEDSNEDIKTACGNPYVKRRLQELIDIVSPE